MNIFTTNFLTAKVFEASIGSQKLLYQLFRNVKTFCDQQNICGDCLIASARAFGRKDGPTHCTVPVCDTIGRTDLHCTHYYAYCVYYAQFTK